MKKIVLTLFTAILLILSATTLSDGVRHGLDVCGMVLIPSLFPFLIFTAYLNEKSVVSSISPTLDRISRVFLHSHGEEMAVFLVSLLSGYPAGATMLSAMLKNGEISKSRADAAIYYCFSAGPAFIYTAVGQGILHSSHAGLILLCSHICASIITAFTVGITHKTDENSARTLHNKNGNIVSAVTNATASMIAICAITIAFSAALNLVYKLPIPTVANCVVSSLLEVTNACVVLPKVTFYLPLYSAVIGFGGLSVILQICSIYKNINIKKFVFFRLYHAGLSFLICTALCALFPIALETSALTPKLNVYTAPFSLAMILMCVVFCVSAYTSQNSEKI